MIIRAAAAADAETLAAVHASAFALPWSAEDMRRFAGGAGAWALAAELDGEIAGFILCRALAGEAEILTLAVRPERRRRGVAGALLAAATALAARSAGAMVLEVAVDNASAIALYGGAGFEPVGRRRAYYGRPVGGAVDAIVMRRLLNS